MRRKEGNCKLQEIYKEVFFSGIRSCLEQANENRKLVGF